MARREKSVSLGRDCSRRKSRIAGSAASSIARSNARPASSRPASRKQMRTHRPIRLISRTRSASSASSSASPTDGLCTGQPPRHGRHGRRASAPRGRALRTTARSRPNRCGRCLRVRRAPTGSRLRVESGPDAAAPRRHRVRVRLRRSARDPIAEDPAPKRHKAAAGLRRAGAARFAVKHQREQPCTSADVGHALLQYPREPDGFVDQTPRPGVNARSVLPAAAERRVDRAQHGIEPRAAADRLGNFERDPACADFAFARTSRWPIVAGATTNARAIAAASSPSTVCSISGV